MPVTVFITSGTTADCTVAEELIADKNADYVLADKGYDSQSLIDYIESKGAKTVIPPRINRKNQRYYDKNLYKIRHLVENAFLRLKEWRSIATRYAKNVSSYLAIVQIRCLFQWLKVL
jgi:transposase